MVTLRATVLVLLCLAIVAWLVAPEALPLIWLMGSLWLLVEAITLVVRLRRDADRR